jgi:hypothetical protein
MEEEKKRVFEMPDGRKVEVSYDDIDMIFKGYRPRLMSPEDFRFIGKIFKKEVKEHKKGRMIHLSKLYNNMKGRTYVKKS